MAIRGDPYLKNRNLFLSSLFINQSKALIELIIKIDNKSFFNKYFMRFLFYKLKDRIFYLWRKLGEISLKLNLLVYFFFNYICFEKKIFSVASVENSGRDRPRVATQKKKPVATEHCGRDPVGEIFFLLLSCA